MPHHAAFLSTNALSSLPTSALNFSTSCQQSNGRLSFVFKHDIRASFACSIPASFSAILFLACSFFRSSSKSLATTVLSGPLDFDESCDACAGSLDVPVIFSDSRVKSGFSVNDGPEEECDDVSWDSLEMDSEREVNLLSACSRCFCNSAVTRCCMMSSRFLARDESV